MMNPKQKRAFVKWVTLGLSVGMFGMTANLAAPLLSYPIPVISGFTVKDVIGVLGFGAFFLMLKREV